MSTQRIISSVTESKPDPHPSCGTYDGPYLARARAMVSIERGAGESVGVEDVLYSPEGYRAYHADLGNGLLLGTVSGYYSWEHLVEAETQERALSKARAWAVEVESKLNVKLLAREESLARWRRRMLDAGVPIDFLVED